MPERLHPAGGSFNLHDTPIYFLAYPGSSLTDAHEQHPYQLIAVEVMTQRLEDQLDIILNDGARILLDSGIFSLTNAHARAHGVSMDQALALAPEEIDGFDDLWEKYLGVVTRFGDRLWGYIELDQGGAINKRRTRARLEALGFRPIPVYHPINDGWDYLDELLAGYDRICVGNLVQAPPTIRIRLLATIQERLRAYPDTWVHYLGVTPSPLLVATAVPHASCDSSTWYSPARGWHWCRDYAATAPLGYLSEAAGRAAVEANNTNRPKLFQLMAYLGHHLHENWRTWTREDS